ncbi:hypothetical protein FA13DRAFT_1742929 [Coprinellus micaceus]|uniref:Uncharacterized protein n=1 Tax=Coprinellus micaceus TaxID=71717 RepID=A0A4Y7SF52_COPMI|nr:hypothetical protein FA13DRAFT_1742929 [Coprinellus micaceus]
MVPALPPPRVLRVIAGCTVAAVTLVGTLGLLMHRRSTDVLPLLGKGNLTYEVPQWPQLKPTWTTEQEEPRFAYAQYATTLDYLCNAVINFNLLKRYGAKQDFVLIYPKSWSQGVGERSCNLP